MNVQQLKVVGLVVVLLGLIAGLVAAVRWHADSVVVGVFGTAIGAGTTVAFAWFTRNGNGNGNGNGGNGNGAGPAAVFLVAATILAAGDGCSPAKRPSPDTIEAGVATVNDGCTFLEGITDNRTVISVCATIEEIAWLVASWAPLFAAQAPDAGACLPIGTTGLCATAQQQGRMVQALIQRRVQRFVLDAGAQ